MHSASLSVAGIKLVSDQRRLQGPLQVPLRASLRSARRTLGRLTGQSKVSQGIKTAV